MLFPKFSLVIHTTTGYIYCVDEPVEGSNEVRLLGIGTVTKEVSDNGVFSIAAVSVTLDSSGEMSGNNPRYLMSSVQLDGLLCEIIVDYYESVIQENPGVGISSCNIQKLVKSTIDELTDSKVLFSGFIEGPIEHNDTDLTVSFTISTLPLSNSIGLNGSKIWQ